MIDFQYVRAASSQQAVDEVATDPTACVIAGGTNLVDLMREGIAHPARLVDIGRLPLADIEDRPDGGLRIGALAINHALAAHPRVRERYAVLSQAILSGASPQIRNRATTAGNLLQRTRCVYFYDEAARCNKRTPGAGCDARDGFNRQHAILGGSPHCVATHPSDMAVAMAVTDAVIRVEGRAGGRGVPIDALYRLPGDTPHVETSLEHGDLITHVDVPPWPAETRSVYRKVRDRASFAFALVSIAAAVRIEAGRLVDVRIALGGVAPRPWRARSAEQILRGEVVDPARLVAAADAEMSGALGLRHNAFKIGLAHRLIVDTLQELAA